MNRSLGLCQAAAAMNMPADGCCGTDPDKHTAEIWMILHGKAVESSVAFVLMAIGP